MAQAQITSFAVAGDPRDPFMKLRNAMFRTIAIEFTHELEEKMGGGSSAISYDIAQPKPDFKMVESKAMVCLRCNTPVALLIFAPDVSTSGELKDHARMMYSKTLDMNLPTCVIGEEEELASKKEALALILKIWPERKKAEKISSLKFEPMLYQLQSRHYQR